MVGSFKKKWEVLKATRRETFKVLTEKAGERKFGSSGGFTINDPAEAREIDQKYGRSGSQEVVVMPVDDYTVESGHKYSFGRHPGVPWAKYDDLGRRLPDPPSDGNKEKVRPAGVTRIRPE
jgi:hypothetical protein